MRKVGFASSAPVTFTSRTTARSVQCRSSKWQVHRTPPRAVASEAAPGTSTASTVESVVAKDLGMMRIGHGYDLHRLEEGRPLVLGGLNLPHNVGCAGHSDGDAVYHCVVDAILGALALPDIGQLFPDTDPRFKDQDSHVFMTAAYARMHLAGYRIGNLDVTLIIERPKISPHKEKMRANIAELLHADIGSVNLKAKTHEKVDAVGENRAVEVHAVVVLLKDGPGWTPQTLADDPQTKARAATSTVLESVASRVKQIADIKNGTVQSEQMTNNAETKECTGATTSECELKLLYETVVERARAGKDSSWTAKLFSKGREKIAQKVGEEGVEVVVDAVADNSSGVVAESADLLYHLCVLWAHMGIEPDEVFDELTRRRGTSGISEKKARGKKQAMK